MNISKPVSHTAVSNHRENTPGNATDASSISVSVTVIF